jgi:uncharacterized membrane protein
MFMGGLDREDLVENAKGFHMTRTDDPLVATRPYGRGAVLAYMSDPAPHWGCNFVQWDDYDRFWTGAVEHLLEMRHSIGRTS